MNYKDLWTSHSHRINADDSEKYMDEEDFNIAILEWESAKKVSRVELPVKPATCEHNFQIAKRDYYKPDGGQNAFGKTYDQSRTYSTLFCTKCGETKEIITS